MVPSTTDTIADNPPPPSPRPLPPPPVSPSLNLSWCQSAKGGRRNSLSALLARFQTPWQRCKMAVGGVWILDAGKICQSCTREDSAEWHLGEIDDMICWQDFSVHLCSSNLFSLWQECEHLLRVILFSNQSMGQQWFESANRRTGSKRERNV